MSNKIDTSSIAQGVVEVDGMNGIIDYNCTIRVVLIDILFAIRISRPNKVQFTVWRQSYMKQPNIYWETHYYVLLYMSITATADP